MRETHCYINTILQLSIVSTHCHHQNLMEHFPYMPDFLESDKHLKQLNIQKNKWISLCFTGALERLSAIKIVRMTFFHGRLHSCTYVSQSCINAVRDQLKNKLLGQSSRCSTTFLKWMHKFLARLLGLNLFYIFLCALKLHYIFLNRVPQLLKLLFHHVKNKTFSWTNSRFARTTRLYLYQMQLTGYTVSYHFVPSLD